MDGYQTEMFIAFAEGDKVWHYQHAYDDEYNEAYIALRLKKLITSVNELTPLGKQLYYVMETVKNVQQAVEQFRLAEDGLRVLLAITERKIGGEIQLQSKIMDIQGGADQALWAMIRVRDQIEEDLQAKLFAQLSEQVK